MGKKQFLWNSLRKFVQIVNTLTISFSLIGTISLFCMVFLIAVNALARRIFGWQVIGAWELSTSLLVIIIFLSFAQMQARKRIIRVEIIWNLLGSRGKALLEIFNSIVSLFLSGIIIYMGWEWAWESLEIREYMHGAARIPYFPSKFSIPIGMFLLFIQYLMDLLANTKIIVEKERKK